MHLNLPIFDQLASCKNLLIAGMGGGFDVFCGLPIYFELQQRGQKAHLANFSFSDTNQFQQTIRLNSDLAGVQAADDWRGGYAPELHLARWFQDVRAEEITIWCFNTTGTRQLLEGYRLLIERLAIDGILLIDGGVDSLIRGDEDGTGTLIEDAISLYTVNELSEIPVRLMACLGMGAEQDMNYAHIMQDIAHLTKAGAFLGSCSLVPQMEAYQLYEQAVLYAQSREFQDPSVINSSIVSAVQGEYGDFHLTKKTRGSHMWISPLMAIYWCFDLPGVARENLWLHALAGTETVYQASSTFIRTSRQNYPTRGMAPGPLP
jgi:hypothetical protein